MSHRFNERAYALQILNRLEQYIAKVTPQIPYVAVRELKAEMVALQCKYQIMKAESGYRLR